MVSDPPGFKTIRLWNDVDGVKTQSPVLHFDQNILLIDKRPLSHTAVSHGQEHSG